LNPARDVTQGSELSAAFSSFVQYNQQRRKLMATTVLDEVDPDSAEAKRIFAVLVPLAKQCSPD